MKGMKNKKGEPVYKAADHMKEDLLASGVFSEHEVTKLFWSEFDSERLTIQTGCPSSRPEAVELTIGQ